MFKKIVVGLDGSEHAEHALRIACDLAGKYGSELHLIHSPQPQTVAFAMGAVSGYHIEKTMPADKEVQAAGEKIIAAGSAIVAQMGQTVTAAQIARGNAAQEIVACADACGADLIITGRRGLGSLGSLLQGSTSLAVSHLSKCACLSVV